MNKKEFMFAEKRIYEWKVSSKTQREMTTRQQRVHSNTLSSAEKLRHRQLCEEYGLTATYARQ